MLNKFKKISARDIFGIFKFILVLIPATIYGSYLRITKKHMWLICEREDMARDNGLAFFEFMQNEHPDLKTYYAIDKNNPDYEYVKEYKDKIVQWASLRHYFLYMSATRNLSSHKEGNPNHTLFTILHLYLNLYNNRVFLQHGILKDDAPMFYYSKTKFRYFICGAKPEYDYISSHYGYPDNHVFYTGLARYDKLDNKLTDNNIIAFIPTWRRWLNDKNIDDSEYKKRILEFLNNKKLEKYLEKNNKTIFFYPHASVQAYFNAKEIKNSHVFLKKKKDMSINQLIRLAGCLITDYSSLFFDFAYLGKPIFYFQPDYTEFRKNHNFKEGYFLYNRDGFGPVIETIEDLVLAICIPKHSKKYDSNRNRFFVYNDKKNCERIFEVIK